MRKCFFKLHKTLIFLFIAAILTVFGTQSAYAESLTAVMSFAEDGYKGTEQYIFAPAENDGDDPSSILLNLSGTRWDFSGDTDHENRRANSGIQIFSAQLTDRDLLLPEGVSLDDKSNSDLSEFYGYTELSLDYSGRNYDLTDYQSLRFGINVQNGGIHYPVHIRLETTGGIYESETYITTDGSSSNYSHVFFNLSDVSGEIIKLNIRIEYSRGEMPEQVRCTLPYITKLWTSGFSNAERFSTHRLRAETGSAALTSGIVRPDRSGSAYISAKLAVKKQPTHNSSAYFELKFSGITNGNLTLSVLYAGTTAEQRQYSKKISLTSHDGIYTIPIDVYDDIHSFSLQFDNLECDGMFTIDSIKLYSGARSLLSGNSDIGSVASIKRNGDSITFGGTIERNYVKQFSDESIYFYAIPGSTPDDLSSAFEIGSVKVSTIFESTVDLSEYPSLADTFMFFAAIKTVDSSGNEQILPLSHPKYTDAAPISPSNVSNVGLYNAPTVGAFESNVSHVMVDVPLDRLISTNSSSAASTAYIAYGNDEENGNIMKQVYFDHTLLDELDSDIEFYISAGVEVYLKLSSFSAIEGMSHDADGTSDVLNKYAAVIRFLAWRYSGIAGIVLGDGINSSEFVGEDTLANAASYASIIAEMCRITYNAASSAIPDILVVVPFVPNTGGGEWISERTLAVMLSERLSDIGQIPWAYLYTFSDADTDLVTIDSMNKLLYELEIEGAGAAMFLYKTTNSSLLADYLAYTAGLSDEEAVEYNAYAAASFADICDLCSSYKARAVFFSLDGISVRNDQEFYSELKNAGQSDRFVYDSYAVPSAENGNTASSFTLWDFTNQYHTLDWIAGGGVSSCCTVSSTRFLDDPENEYGRVLRSIFDSENSSGAAGIILRNFHKEYDFSAIDSIDFTFSLEKIESDEGHLPLSHDDGGVTLVFVIGTDDYRAEYYADNAEYGKVQRFSCDLTEYEYRNTIDYVGIMVYADNETALDLSTVSISSMELGEDELAEMFAVSEDEADKIDRLSLGVFIGIIAVMTASVVIILNRRDREEEELRELQRRNDAKAHRTSREHRTSEYTRR